MFLFRNVMNQYLSIHYKVQCLMTADCSMDHEGQDGCSCSESDTGGQIDGKTSTSTSTSLSPFGLATYRMQGDLWLKPDTSDYDRIVDLYHAADSWLKQLGVQHHDFNFFSLHSSM